jgi:hypothetical protein
VRDTWPSLFLSTDENSGEAVLPDMPLEAPPVELPPDEALPPDELLGVELEELPPEALPPELLLPEVALGDLSLELEDDDWASALPAMRNSAAAVTVPMVLNIRNAS